MELNMELTNKIINSFLCLSAAAALGAGGMYLYHRDAIKGGADYKLIKEAEEILDDNGMKFPDGITKEEAALNGYLAAYGDKYTFYSNSDNVDEYLTSVNGLPSLVTCGYTVARSDDGRLEVESVSAESIAEKQGLCAGDIILQVDSKSVINDGLAQTAFELQGNDGTVMRLLIERDGSRRELDFTRANDPEKEVDNVQLKLMDDVLYIRLTSFDNYTPALLIGKMDEYKDKYKKLIIDLRDNGGGRTDGATGCADVFLSEGEQTDHYANDKVETRRMMSSDSDVQLPTVVLINEKTASGAEIMAGLLKQYGKDVTLLGKNTFGKGVFQREEELSNGGVLRYTAGYITVGEWECYDKKGIAPDVEVEMDRALIGTDDDVQLKKALKKLA